MRPDDAVLVEAVVVVMAGPGAAGADRLERRDARGKRRPDDLLEQRPVRLEIVGRRRNFAGLGFRPAGDEHRPLRADIDAGRVDGERHVGKLPARLEHEDAALARLDRQGKSGQRRDLAATRPGGIDKGADTQPFTAGQHHAADAAAFNLDGAHLAGDLGALRPLSARRNSAISACASNQPSPLRPKAPPAMPSVASQLKRRASAA